MFEEDDFFPLSALQHFIYCERQAALIHLERIWLDNAFTSEGSEMHKVVDAGKPEVRDGVLVRRSIALRSARLGLTGKADVVEFHPVDEGQPGVALDGIAGRWRILPVEYKRGKPKAHRADEVQLCAQALCLEESFRTEVPVGALFYGRTRRRQTVVLTQELRDLTEDTAHQLHRLLRSGVTPMSSRSSKCDRCSLLPACLPLGGRQARSAQAYLESVLGLAQEAPDA